MHADSDVQSRIDKLDLEPIKFKLAKASNFTNDEIALTEKWYRRFLFLAWKYPDRAIVIPEPVDEMWHHHILDTRKYADDCNSAFGEFLHHFPYFGLRGADDARALRQAFEETNEIMQGQYGENARDEFGALRTEWSNEEAASSCSDCSGSWRSPFPQGEERPRLTPPI